MHWRVLSAMCIFFITATAGCHSEDGPCAAGCKKIAKCLGITDTESWKCPLSEACSSEEECKALCYIHALCPAITGEDPKQQQALDLCRAKCVQQPDDGGSQDQVRLDLGAEDVSSREGVSRGPDLVVSLFSATVNDTTVSFSAEICNIGASVDQLFDLRVFFDQTSAPGCAESADEYETIAELDAGECLQHTFTRNNTPLGSYTAWVVVDGGCVLLETDESNNHISAEYTVSSSEMTDLTVDALTAQVSNTTVSFDINVCNNGASTSSTFELGLRYDGPSAPICLETFDEIATISGLSKGACSNHTFTRSSTPSGSYKAWALIDATCQIVESSESNNAAYATYTVSDSTGPDLVVQEFTAQVAGSSVVFGATVCNNGSDVSTPFDLAIFPSQSSPPACSSPADKQWMIEGLASGSCTTTFSYTYTSTGTSGTYLAWASADADCVVPEASEANNTVSVSYTLEPGTCTTTTYDFDDGTGQGLTETHTDGQVLWHVSSQRAHSGGNSIRYANSSTNNYAGSGSNSGTATLPSVSIPSTGTSELSFWLWADVEVSTGYDILYLAIDGANIWQKTQTNIAYKSWDQVTADLSAYQGQSVDISFTFDTKDSSDNDTEGIYIDDIQLNLGCP